MICVILLLLIQPILGCSWCSPYETCYKGVTGQEFCCSSRTTVCKDTWAFIDDEQDPGNWGSDDTKCCKVNTTCIHSREYYTSIPFLADPNGWSYFANCCPTNRFFVCHSPVPFSDSCCQHTQDVYNSTTNTMNTLSNDCNIHPFNGGTSCCPKEYFCPTDFPIAEKLTGYYYDPVCCLPSEDYPDTACRAQTNLFSRIGDRPVTLLCSSEGEIVEEPIIKQKCNQSAECIVHLEKMYSYYHIHIKMVPDTTMKVNYEYLYDGSVINPDIWFTYVITNSAIGAIERIFNESIVDEFDCAPLDFNDVCNHTQKTSIDSSQVGPSYILFNLTTPDIPFGSNITSNETIDIYLTLRLSPHFDPNSASSIGSFMIYLIKLLKTFL